MFLTDNNNDNSSNFSKVQYTATIAEPVLNINSIANRSRYTTIKIPNTNPTKYSRVSVHPQRNPIKHYRRQYSTTTSRHPSQLKMLDMPGKSIIRLDECPNCDMSNVAFTCVELEQNDNTCCKVEHRHIMSRLKGSSTLTHIDINNKYSHDFRGYLERTCRSYNNNPHHKPQNLVKNRGECNIVNNHPESFMEYWSNKRTTSNGTTSIASYRRQYQKNYKEIATIPDPRQCCVQDSNPTHNNCDPHAYPNLTHRKLICSNLFTKNDNNKYTIIEIY